MQASQDQELDAGRPRARQPDAFELGGMRRLALSIIILTLEELTWDPQEGRSKNDCAERLRQKQAAPGWIQGAAFETFFDLSQLPISLASMRERCMDKPLLVREWLLQIRQDLERELADTSTARENRLQASNQFANSWPFQRAAKAIQEVLLPARPQGFLFDELATTRERAQWRSSPRPHPVRHQLSPRG